MAIQYHQECPNCDDSQLDIQVLDEKRDDHLGLHLKKCRWICLNCGWLSKTWEATN